MQAVKLTEMLWNHSQLFCLYVYQTWGMLQIFKEFVTLFVTFYESPSQICIPQDKSVGGWLIPLEIANHPKAKVKS